MSIPVEIKDMNVGQQTIEWLFSEQLKVDREWSVRTAKGFRWWAHKHAQAVEVIGEERGPDGNTGYFISVRTDVLRELTPTDAQRVMLNETIMPSASMAGLVYDEAARTLSLASLVRVHDVIAAWMRPIISIASILQLAEAQILADNLADDLDAEPAESAPPGSPMREEPDEMAGAVDTVVRPMGMMPARWSPFEFTEAVRSHMNRPPALLGTDGGRGFTVEFPFGKGDSSLCTASAEEPHPHYGNGLTVVQSFAAHGKSPSEGARLALSLNEVELTQRPFGYGFGSYIFLDGKIKFVSFYPNALYRPGLLPNMFYACAGRAREVSIRLSGSDWQPASFTPKRSAVGRLMDLFRSPPPSRS